MLNACLDSESKIMIRGYDSILYNELLSHWTKTYFDIASHAGENTGTKAIKREVIWMNY